MSGGSTLHAFCAHDMRGTIYHSHKESLILDRTDDERHTGHMHYEAGRELHCTIIHSSEHHYCVYLQHVMYLFHYHCLLCDLEEKKMSNEN